MKNNKESKGLLVSHQVSTRFSGAMKKVYFCASFFWCRKNIGAKRRIAIKIAATADRTKEVHYSAHDTIVKFLRYYKYVYSSTLTMCAVCIYMIIAYQVFLEKVR